MELGCLHYNQKPPVLGGFGLFQGYKKIMELKKKEEALENI